MTVFHDQLIPAQGNLRRSVAAIRSEKIEDDWHTGNFTRDEVSISKFSAKLLNHSNLKTHHQTAKNCPLKLAMWLMSWSKRQTVGGLSSAMISMAGFQGLISSQLMRRLNRSVNHHHRPMIRF